MDKAEAVDEVAELPQSSVKDVNNANVAKSPNITASFAEMFSMAGPLDCLFMVVGTLGALTTGASIPFFNILFGRMLDSLNGDPNSFSTNLNLIVISFCVVAGVNLFSGWFQVTLWSMAGERQTQKFRERYVQAILSQEIGWFDTCGAGELSTKVAELTGKIQDGIGRKSGDLIQYITQMVCSYIVAFYLNWKLTVVLLAAFPLIAGAGAFMITAITAAQNQSMDQYAAAGGLATESLSAIRTVTALNAQPDVINRYRKFLLEAMQVGITKGMKVGIGNGGLFCACFLTYALGFWYSGKLVADSLESDCGAHCLTGGTVLTVFFSSIMGSMALGQIAPPMTAFFAAKAAVAPILELIRRVPLIDGFSEEGLKPTEKERMTRGQIEFKGVVFAYPSRPNNLICKGYDLLIKQGESVAIVGASGCGKSTVINLILRFYDPKSGSVTLDGFDVRSLNVRWLRSQVGYVGQEPVLFAGSIFDNIAYGLDPTVVPEAKNYFEAKTAEEKAESKEALKSRIVAAAKMANAHQFIADFPEGYDTDVGSNGGAMSGGQKQRIAIARALVKKPIVLLLDEATSALDSASERLVQESIDQLQASKTQTTVIIAHRLSTIQNADKIAVIRDGKIAEIGTHEQLMQADSTYADLVRLQVTGQADESEASEEGFTPYTGRRKSSSDADVGRARLNSTASVESKQSGVPNEEVQGAEKVENAELSKEESNALNRKIWAYILKHPLWLAAAIFGGAAFGSVFPVWGMVLAQTQSMFYLSDPDRIRYKASVLAGVYVLLAFVCLFSSLLQFWGIAQVGERVSLRLRSEMFESILRREIAYFDREENAIGSITTRLANDSRTVNKAAGETVAKQIQAVFTLAVGLGIGLGATWKIALVVLATFPLSIISSSIQMQAIAGQLYDQDGNDGGHGGLISTAFTHMRTVSAFSVQFRVLEQYAGMTRVIAADRSKRSITAGFGFGASNTSLFLTYSLLFWYGSQLIKAGEIDFEQLMTAILSLMLGALGLGQALADLGDQKAGVQAAKRIFDMVEEGKESPIDGLSQNGEKPSDRCRGKIELRGVNFNYPSRPDVPVCRDYNLTIEPGEVVALVGPSGSGKSTIMGLLLRFYDPDSGEVLLDGRNLKNVNVRWLRSQIGYVGQEPVLFQGSVAANIARGRADFSDTPLKSLGEAMLESDQGADGCCNCHKMCPSIASGYSHVRPPEGDVEMAASSEVGEDILRAARESNADDFISGFQKGYETDVGEGSIMVSGGQKQRIAIARALVKRPAVLLLDEATSALDAASERLVQESIDQLQASKMQTTIIIAHRLTTIKNADKIAVIDKGRVVEMGNHDQLLARNGLYAQLWAKQRGGLNKVNSGDVSSATQK